MNGRNGNPLGKPYRKHHVGCGYSALKSGLYPWGLGTPFRVDLGVYSNPPSTRVLVSPRTRGFHIKPDPPRLLPVRVVPAECPGFGHPGYTSIIHIYIYIHTHLSQTRKGTPYSYTAAVVRTIPIRHTTRFGARNHRHIFRRAVGVGFERYSYIQQ